VVPIEQAVAGIVEANAPRRSFAGKSSRRHRGRTCRRAPAGTILMAISKQVPRDGGHDRQQVEMSVGYATLYGRT